MTTATETSYQEIDTTRLRPSPLNRKHFDAARFAELLASVKKDGVRTPLIVRPVAGGAFEIAAGERRWKAATQAELPTVPAIVRAMDDVTFLEYLTFENFNRDDAHPLDEAEGFQRLLELTGGDEGKWTAERIAAKRGVSPGYVYLALRRLKLVKPVREAFLAGAIEKGHADDLARLAPDDQLHGLKAAAGKLPGTFRRDAMTVRELRDFIQREIVRDLSKAPFDIKDATLVAAAGACGPCPKRAANNPELFAEIAKGDRCMDGSCFAAKTDAWLDGIRTQARQAATAIEGCTVVDVLVTYHQQSERKGTGPEKYQRANDKPCNDYAIGVAVDDGAKRDHFAPQLQAVLNDNAWARRLTFRVVPINGEDMAVLTCKAVEAPDGD